MTEHNELTAKVYANEQNKDRGEHETFINILTTRATTSCKINSNMICRYKM